MTDNPTLSDDMEVTQADRDAAAKYCAMFRDYYNAKACENGERDDAEFVQAFARHRLSTRDDGLREAVHAAAIKWCGEKERETFPEDVAYFKGNWAALPGLRQRVGEQAILALLSPQPEQPAPAGDGEGLRQRDAMFLRGLGAELREADWDEEHDAAARCEALADRIFALRNQSQPVLTDERVEARNLFANDVWNALKTDTNDLRKQQRIIMAYDAALASMGEGE